MLHASLRFRKRLEVLIALAWFTSGCGEQAALRAPISKFRDASTVVVQSAKVYLVTLNKNERDAYIFQRLEFREQIKRSDLDRVQVFSDESIAVRTKTLDQISEYTGLLYTLVNGETQVSLQARADNLKTSLINLSAEVSRLSGADDARFKTAANTAFPVIDALLQEFLNNRIEHAVRRAIAQGTRSVNDLIEALRLDMDVEYERRRSTLSGKVTAAILEYNREIEKGDAADSEKLLAGAQQISTVEDQAELLLTCLDFLCQT